MKITAKRLLVLGQGPEAQALVATLAALPGVVSVGQQAAYAPLSILPQADLCIEMLGGVSVAYAAAMQALAQGMGLVVGSAILAATHGKILSSAASGQGAFFACAAHGLGPLPTLLQSVQASQLLWLPGGVTQAAIARMYARHEAPELALRQLQLRGADVADAGGKYSHLRAHALLGAWQGAWLNPARQVRLGLEVLMPEFLPFLNSLQLRLAYGSLISAEVIYTGPLLRPVSFSIPEPAVETIHATTPGGEMQLTLPSTTGLEAAILAAVHTYTAGQRRLHALGAPKAAEPGAWQVTFPPAGAIQAAVVPLGAPVESGTLVLPVVGPYRPPAVDTLRLVG